LKKKTEEKNANSDIQIGDCFTAIQRFSMEKAVLKNWGKYSKCPD
jgi:hypothetical protein